jgi:N-acyl-L-homoserine lactone synthetase
MSTKSLADEIALAKAKFEIIPADTAVLRNEVYQLRYQVYCVENNFLTGINGLEMDEYDARARHMILRHRQSGKIVGTVRLISPMHDRPEASLPMLRFCDPSLLKDLPLTQCGEGSRFAISRQRLTEIGSDNQVLRLWLIQAVVRMSVEAGHSHILAILDPRLFRLFHMNGIIFRKLGPPVDYHGLRQPAAIEIETMFEEVRSTHPLIWNVMTDDGCYASLLADRKSFRSERVAQQAEYAA